MSEIRYIISENGDLHFYERKEDAEAYMEPIDVENGEYVGYDAEGRLLKIESARQKTRISLAEEEPSHVAELQMQLMGFASRAKVPLKEVDLPGLLSAFEPFLTKKRS